MVFEAESSPKRAHCLWQTLVLISSTSLSFPLGSDWSRLSGRSSRFVGCVKQELLSYAKSTEPISIERMIGYWQPARRSIGRSNDMRLAGTIPPIFQCTHFATQ